MKACSSQEILIVFRRTEEVVPDRAARSNLLVRNCPADHKSITEQEPAARFQNTEQFLQHPEPSGNMAHDIVREGRVKAGIGIGQSLRSVAVLEADPVREVSSMRECVAVAETRSLHIRAH